MTQSVVPCDAEDIGANGIIDLAEPIAKGISVMSFSSS